MSLPLFVTHCLCWTAKSLSQSKKREDKWLAEDFSGRKGPQFLGGCSASTKIRTTWRTLEEGAEREWNISLLPVQKHSTVA